MLSAPYIENDTFPSGFDSVPICCNFSQSFELSQAVSMKCLVLGSKFFRQAVPTLIPSNKPPSSHLYEFKSASGPGTMPPPSIQEEPSAEKIIQAHEPMPYISKYEPLHTATATPFAISSISCCIEGDD